MIFIGKNKRQTNFSEYSVGTRIKDWANDRPDLSYPLIGGLTGAGIGAVGELLIGDKEKSKRRRMLEGGLLGGGLGAVAGFIQGSKEYVVNKVNIANRDQRDNLDRIRDNIDYRLNKTRENLEYCYRRIKDAL